MKVGELWESKSGNGYICKIIKIAWDEDIQDDLVYACTVKITSQRGIVHAKCSWEIGCHIKREKTNHDGWSTSM